MGEAGRSNTADVAHAGAASDGRGSIPRRRLSMAGSASSRLLRDVLDAGGELWVSGAGQSMHATIRHADDVLLAPPNRSVARGDIVLFPQGRQLVLHRVVRVAGSTLHTRGDAREGCDAPVQLSEVIGRAIAVRRGGQITVLGLTLRFGTAALVRFLLRELVRGGWRLRRALRTRSRGRVLTNDRGS